MIHVLVAAALFGAAIPLCKVILGDWDEVPLAGTLYLASGLGLLLGRKFLKTGEPLRPLDLRWLSGAVLFGGIAAPVALLEDMKTGKTYFAHLNEKVKGVRIKQIQKNKVTVSVHGKTVELR